MNAPVDRYELYRIVTDYEALRDAFIERVEDLAMSRLAIDELGGFTPGYGAKLLCQPPMKLIGADSLPKLLKATGLALVLAVDNQRMEQIRPHLKPKRKIRAVARIKRVKGYFTKENAAKISEKRWADVPQEMRRKIMRKVAKARWRKRRMEERLASLGSPADSNIPSAQQPITANPAPLNSR